MGRGTRLSVCAGGKRYAKQSCSKFSTTAVVTCSNSSCGMRTGDEPMRLEVEGHKVESHTSATWSAYMVSSFSSSAS